MSAFVGLLIAVLVIVAIIWFSLRSSKVVIPNPKLGYLNLLGDEGQRLLEEDRGSLGALFSASEESVTLPPICNVLIIYCLVNEDGTLKGIRNSLREIIRGSEASIVLVASPNSGEAYSIAGKEVGFGYANLVMTLNRKGQSFGRFFQTLFKQMFAGMSMPLAWVKLAPQGGPEEGGLDTPETMCFLERGQVAFK